MFRRSLLLTCTLCSAACAQIAGFETLSSESSESPQGGRTSAAAGATGATSAGNSTQGGNGADGAAAGAASAASGSSSGGALASAGRAGNVANAGSSPVVVAGSGGSISAAGSGNLPPLRECSVSLLRNGNFDAGPVDWYQYKSLLGVASVVLNESDSRLLANKPIPSPPYAAQLAPEPNGEFRTRVNLLQLVHIPKNVSKLVISGRFQIKTEEDPSANVDAAFDRLDLALQEQDPDSDFFRSLALWFFNDASNGWIEFRYDEQNWSLDDVRDRTLEFAIEAKFGSTKKTSFWVDSLSLVPECQ